MRSASYHNPYRGLHSFASRSRRTPNSGSKDMEHGDKNLNAAGTAVCWVHAGDVFCNATRLILRALSWYLVGMGVPPSTGVMQKESKSNTGYRDGTVYNKTGRNIRTKK